MGTGPQQALDSSCNILRFDSNVFSALQGAGVKTSSNPEMDVSAILLSKFNIQVLLIL